MIHDIRESTASLAQTSNTSESFFFCHIRIYVSSIALPAEDLLITQAIYLPSCSDNDALSEESGSPDDVNNSADKTSGKNFERFSNSCIIFLMYFRESCWSSHFNWQTFIICIK
jgi:hypothetical protein